MRRILAALLASILCLALPLMGGAALAENEELKEYAAEGIGAFYLPEGFEMETGTFTEPFELPYVRFTRGDVTVQVNHFTQAVYDATGTALPADLEEYSQRPGAQKDLPEGGAYAEDEYGNLSVSYAEDGVVTYLMLMAGEASFATAIVNYPEGAEGIGAILEGLSQTVLT